MHSRSPLRPVDFRDAILIASLGSVAGALSIFAPEAFDCDFLATLIPATAQILAFTGIILGIFYPALHRRIDSIDRQIERWDSRLDEEKNEKVRAKIIDRINQLAGEAEISRRAQTRAVASLMFSAFALGVTLVLEVLHLRLLRGVSSNYDWLIWIASPPYAPILRDLVSAFEMALLTVAIACLVRGLAYGARLAFD